MRQGDDDQMTGVRYGNINKHSDEDDDSDEDDRD
jgi:hypothetical protein